MLDIEKEGFVFKYKEDGNHNVVFTEPYENHPRGYTGVMIDVVYNDKSNRVS